MKIDRPSPSLIPQLRNLWKEAFGDSDAFLDCFFSLAYAPERCRCVTVEGAVKAALYWLDANCAGQKFAYLYAVATAADSRSKGLCRMLMEDTAAVLKAAGYQGALLVPQDEGLREMYSRMGYLPAGTIDEFLCAGKAAVPVSELTAAAYSSLRQNLLPEGSIEIQGVALEFLGKLARFYSGEGFLAAVSREEEHLRILEYLGNPDAAPALVAALGATEATVRTPGKGLPFAMYRPLSAYCLKPAYYPFAFD